MKGREREQSEKGAGLSVRFTIWECFFFAALIIAMAVIPLISGAWWRKRYPLVTLAIALPCAVGVAIRDPGALPHVAEDYLSFIILIGSLFIIAGGIDVETPAKGRPLSNAAFLLAGAGLANILGTTGASMVLIRPLIRANAWRKRKTHVFIFFIFLVSNIGGMLTPLGDPPLFLGYLQGVPFAWTLGLLPVWGTAVVYLLAVFLLLDGWQIRHEAPDGADQGGRFELHGARNIALLAVVVGSLFMPVIIRDAVMVMAALVSVKVTPAAIRERNDFSYHPIIEVAVLFAGLFVTMIPVQSCIHSFGVGGMVGAPSTAFWTAGALSSVLDNAPTYLIFVEAARQAAAAAGPMIAGVPASLLVAISTGCVMMGANTYIGNGPNLMVQAVCEDEGVRMPAFAGYVIWSAAILIPLYGLIDWLYLSP